MVENKFLPYSELEDHTHPLFGTNFEKIEEEYKLKEIPYYDDRMTIGECFDEFEKGAKIIPLREAGKVKAVLKESKLLELVIMKKLKMTDGASKAQTKEFVIVPFNLDLSVIEKITERHEAILLERVRENHTHIFEVTRSQIVHLLKLKLCSMHNK